MDSAVPIPVLVVLSATLVSAAIDVWRFKVHNLLTIPLLVSGLVYHAWKGGLPAFGESMVGVLSGFGVLVAFYLAGGMGAGDVKLLAAIGAWLKAPLLFYVFLAGSLAAGLYALVLILMFSRGRETLINFKIACYRLMALGRYLSTEDRVETQVARADRRQRMVPFAAMIAIGLVVVVTLLWSRHTGTP